jgi:hypothetical protein
MVAYVTEHALRMKRAGILKVGKMDLAVCGLVAEVLVCNVLITRLDIEVCRVVEVAEGLNLGIRFSVIWWLMSPSMLCE